MDPARSCPLLTVFHRDSHPVVSRERPVLDTSLTGGSSIRTRTQRKRTTRCPSSASRGGSCNTNTCRRCGLSWLPAPCARLARMRRLLFVLGQSDRRHLSDFLQKKRALLVVERFGNWWQFINTRAHTTAKSSLTIWEDLLVPYMIVLYAHSCGGEWPLGRLRHRLPRWPTPHPAQRKSHALGQPASSTVSAHRDNQCRSTVVVTASRFKCQAHHPNNPLSAAPMPAGRPPRRTRTITARSALLGCHPPESALLECHPWRLPWGPHHQPSWLMKKSRSCDSVGVCTGISGSMDGRNGGSATSATPSPPFSSSQRRNTAVSGLMGGLAAVRWGQKRSREAGEEEREVEQERGHAVVATRKKAPSYQRIGSSLLMVEKPASSRSGAGGRARKNGKWNKSEVTRSWRHGKKPPHANKKNE